MTFKRPYRAGLVALAVGLLAATAAHAEPTINKGDNAWMLTSTVLVLLMTIPGLALFYGGLVRSKNMLSVLMQVFYTVCIVILIWTLYGYSLAFTGGSDFIGGFSKAFLMGVTPDSKAATFSVDANISELVYVCFQMTFAAITPALIVGAFAERMKFSAVALFIPLWATLIYFPIAHMVWYWAGPDAISDAVKAIAAAGSDAGAKAAAEAKLAAPLMCCAWIRRITSRKTTGGVRTTARAKLKVSARDFASPASIPAEMVAPEREKPRKGRQSPCTAPIKPACRVFRSLVSVRFV